MGWVGRSDGVGGPLPNRSKLAAPLRAACLASIAANDKVLRILLPFCLAVGSGPTSHLAAATPSLAGVVLHAPFLSGAVVSAAIVQQLAAASTRRPSALIAGELPERPCSCTCLVQAGLQVQRAAALSPLLPAAGIRVLNDGCCAGPTPALGTSAQGLWVSPCVPHCCSHCAADRCRHAGAQPRLAALALRAGHLPKLPQCAQDQVPRAHHAREALLECWRELCWEHVGVWRWPAALWLHAVWRLVGAHDQPTDLVPRACHAHELCCCWFAARAHARIAGIRLGTSRGAPCAHLLRGCVPSSLTQGLEDEVIDVQHGRQVGLASAALCCAVPRCAAGLVLPHPLVSPQHPSCCR